MEQHLERLDWLWRRGSQEAIAAALGKIDDPKQLGEMYPRAFAIAQRWRPSVARFLGEHYVDEFYRDPEPFGLGVRPDTGLLWDLADLYQREGRADLAEWVCEFAVAFGLGGDGTSQDFAGKLLSRGGPGELAQA